MDNNNLSPTPHEIHRKFMKINRLHRSAIENKFSDCKIHRSQHGLLMYLSRAESTPTQRELADRFEVSPAAIAVSLKKLENDGYINREPNESDSRQNMISITAKGRKVVEYSKAAFDELDRKTYCGLSVEELSLLSHLLQKMIDNLER